MPKSAEPITFKSQGYTYELTSTMLRERDDYWHRVRLKDLAKAWKDPKALEEEGVTLSQFSQYYYFQRKEDGSFDIGCRHFSPLKAAIILRAAGVRVASAKKKSKKKAKSKSNKR